MTRPSSTRGGRPGPSATVASTSGRGIPAVWASRAQSSHGPVMAVGSGGVLGRIPCQKIIQSGVVGENLDNRLL